MQRSVTKWAADSQPRLRGDTQGLIDETDLADYISLSQPPDLTFSDHVHRLIATYRIYRTSHRAKPEASGDPLLDESMVLLHDIVQIRSRSTAATCPQFTGLFQFRNGVSVGWMPVHIDHPRSDRRAPQRQLQEALRCE